MKDRSFFFFFSKEFSFSVQNKRLPPSPKPKHLSLGISGSGQEKMVGTKLKVGGTKSLFLRVREKEGGGGCDATDRGVAGGGYVQRGGRGLCFPPAAGRNQLLHFGRGVWVKPPVPQTTPPAGPCAGSAGAEGEGGGLGGLGGAPQCSLVGQRGGLASSAAVPRCPPSWRGL